jgi:hypothetical protein
MPMKLLMSVNVEGRAMKLEEIINWRHESRPIGGTKSHGDGGARVWNPIG